MENTSTPVLNRERSPLNPESDATINSHLEEKEVFCSIKANPPFDVSISPIKKKKKKLRKRMTADLENDTQDQFTITCSNELKHSDSPLVNHNGQENEKNYIVGNVKNEQSLDLSDDLSNYSDELDKMSTCTTELDYSLSDETDINKIKETLSEMKLAAEKYLNKIEKLDISVEWNLSESLQANKGIHKSIQGCKGPLDPEEIAFIKERLEQFCEEHGVNYEKMRLCFSQKVTKLNFPNEIRIKFIQYLCKDYLSDRNPLSVFRAISKLGLCKGKFSNKEVDLLIEMYHSYTGSHLHSVCGLLLNRHRSHVYRKFMRLKKSNLLGSRPPVNTVKDEPGKLQNYILNSILQRKSSYLSGLNYRINNRMWVSIGRELQASPATLKAIYTCNLIPQIHGKHPIEFYKFIKELFESISVQIWNTWEEVKWKSLSNKLYNVGPVFIYAILRKMVMNFVPKEKWRKFNECATYLYENVLPIFKNGKKSEWKKRKLNQILIHTDIIT